MGKIFRKMRTEKGMTAAHVCRETGIKPSRLSKIELGKAEVSGRELLLLCKFYDVDCRSLV